MNSLPAVAPASTYPVVSAKNSVVALLCIAHSFIKSGEDIYHFFPVSKFQLVQSNVFTFQIPVSAVATQTL